ncbi:uncharacterized protein RCC_08955 [Ramularia collo-cygni]|uniref:Vacuolar protein sorting-associated protein 51 homolog n=1 Tax=Ramularia collo-cygni TaxID=112498 RepID=A0A2D3VL79_9PEZI|nr:uncharacterized protein RCC_08955 [Ramularia collo-cygni]CZT23244.1 uncharacterized protein RCC_08955 [Ramularia collo-cygni]
MSTIASPRPSFTLSSRRGSASTDNTVLSGTGKSTTSNAVDRATLRRNRTALRDYYNLKAAASTDTHPQHDLPSPSLNAEQESELDKPGFDPEAYVQHLLSTQGLEGVLRVEAGLLSDIRSLDGEKKALVYDNYSKLIAATDTIRSMREKMDPMTPTTSTLTPAIGHIAETAASLTADLKRSLGEGDVQARDEVVMRQKQQEVVRWVLAAPEQIRKQVEAGANEDAKREWERVESVLERWKTVKGADAVRKACQEALVGLPES